MRDKYGRVEIKEYKVFRTKDKNSGCYIYYTRYPNGGLRYRSKDTCKVIYLISKIEAKALCEKLNKGEQCLNATNVET